MHLVLRAAEQNDWPAIAALLTAANLPLDGAEEHLLGFLLAYQDKALAGCAALERYGSHALLRSVAISEAQRGKDLGSLLVSQILDQARAAGIEDVVLLTTTAADFFPRFGFRVIMRADAPSPVQDSIEFKSACPDSAVVMLLDLSSAR
jgi:amino-acid N-acetyltransferase